MLVSHSIKCGYGVTGSLLHNISNYLPEHHICILESYFNNWKFEVCYDNAISPIRPITVDVPQRSVPGSLLYVLLTADIPTSSHTEIVTFADNTSLLSPRNDYVTAVHNLQTSTDELLTWTKRWKIHFNKEKSICVDFSLRKHSFIPTFIYNQPITVASSTRCLGAHLDKRLTWRTHLIIKRTELNLKFRTLFWLIRPQNKQYNDFKMKSWEWSLSLHGT